MFIISGSNRYANMDSQSVREDGSYPLNNLGERRRLDGPRASKMLAVLFVLR
jgi:hypothetical protein